MTDTFANPSPERIKQALGDFIAKEQSRGRQTKRTDWKEPGYDRVSVAQKGWAEFSSKFPGVEPETLGEMAELMKARPDLFPINSPAGIARSL